jgi:DNA-directed RNA polymerase specialized sigma24 family protein
MAEDSAHSEKVATATLLLMLERREEDQRAALRDEELLSRAGFDINEIATLLDKKPPAVRMSLSRAKAKRT